MNNIAILGLGAFEQHAHHLPFDTDTIIAKSIINNLKIFFNKHNNILFLPVQEVGYSPEHLFDEKTKSLSYVSAIENIVELAKTCKAKNINKILIINAHGGNSPIMAIAAMEIRNRLAMICAYTSWLRFGIPDNIISQNEKHLDIHAGFIETSVMLHLAPQKVQMQYAKNFKNKQEEYIKNYNYLRAYGPHCFGWLMPDLNKDGACGNAALATPEAGKIIFDYGCTELKKLIKELEIFTI